MGAQVVGRAKQPSLDRAARWDGVIPQVIAGEEREKPATLDQVCALVSDVLARRRSAALPTEGYDVVLEADSTGEFMQREPSEPAAWADAGATWWVESWWSLERGEEGSRELRRRVAAGPPAG